VSVAIPGTAALSVNMPVNTPGPRRVAPANPHPDTITSISDLQYFQDPEIGHSGRDAHTVSFADLLCRLS
jgi:hypothetical protein